jgi:hypothetical protein
MDSDTTGPDKKTKFSVFFILGIILLVFMAFLIFAPTKTITENIAVSYTEQEPYVVTEPKSVVEPYTEYEYRYSHLTQISGTGNAYAITDCGDCYCDRQPLPMIFDGPPSYCAYCRCERQSFRTITKNVEVQKIRNVTKTRIESKPAEVNWIIGFKTPYTLHLSFIP